MAGACAQGGLCMRRSCSRSTRQCLCVDRVGASLQSSPAPPTGCVGTESLCLSSLSERAEPAGVILRGVPGCCMFCQASPNMVPTAAHKSDVGMWGALSVAVSSPPASSIGLP